MRLTSHHKRPMNAHMPMNHNVSVIVAANIGPSLAESVPEPHTSRVPEILEIELYRRAMADLVGRRIDAVEAPDPWFLKRGLTAAAARAVLVGRRIEGMRRRGKLLLVDLSEHAPVLGLRFGMTGRPLVDETGAPAELEYGSNQALPAWDRFTLGFAGGGRLRINDPRRLGGVELEPDEDALGPDALSVAPAQLRVALASTAPVKAALLDQSRLAGLGNMLTDEVLFRAAIDPARPARSMSDGELRRLHRAIRTALPELLARGGSHTGRLAVAQRTRGARCPKDGAELVRRTIGGRTTYSCPVHQH